MFCNKCGNQITDGSLFCEYCGAKQMQPQLQQQTIQQPQMQQSVQQPQMQQQTQQPQLQQQPVQQQSPKKNEENNKPLIIALICVGAILLIGIGLLIALLVKRNSKEEVAEVTTEVTTESTTEATTESTTEATTEVTTEATTEATTEDPAEAEYNNANALFEEGKYYSAKKAFENNKYGDWEQRAAECVQTKPETGEIWHDENNTSDNMILTFVVESEEENTSRYIAVYTKDHELVESLFINGTGTVETSLKGGEYYVRSATGTDWYGETELFGEDGKYENMIFDEVEDDRYLTSLEEGYEWKITINTTSTGGQGVESEETDWESWE